MGIKFRCVECDKKLHVKAFLAGKRGVCPHCGAKVRIPHESELPDRAVSTAGASRRTSQSKAGSDDGSASSPSVHSPMPTQNRGSSAMVAGAEVPPGASSLKDPISESPEAVWYVRPPTGGQFGPADGEIMRRWLEEGRVSADALVWREGWTDWKAAGPLFPSLEQPVSQPSPAADPPEELPGDFSFGTESSNSLRGKGRPRSKSRARNVALVVILTLTCAALFVALFIVLRGQ